MSAAEMVPSGTGRVAAVGGGTVTVCCGEQRWQATWGPALLARVARDPGAAPAVGDLVALTWWPDGPVTVDRVTHRVPLAEVVPLHG